MTFKRTKVCLAVLFAIAPGLPSASTKNTTTIVVDETKTVDGYGNNWKSIEIGTTEEAKKGVDSSVLFDHNSPVAKGHNSIAIGTSAEAGGEITEDSGFKTGESIAIGAKAKATREQAIAIGGDTKATGWGSIVIGGDDLTPLHGNVYGEKKIEVGYQSSEAKGEGSIVIGSRSIAERPLSVAVGAISSSTGVASTSVGATSDAKGNMSVAMGFNSQALAENTLAIGSFAKAKQVNSIAIGDKASVDNKSAIAFGNGALVSKGDSNVSIGAGSHDRAVQLIDRAEILADNGKRITYTGFAGSKPSSVFSVGNVGNERQIINVGAGAVSASSTDAINGSQLYAIAKTLKDDLDAINPTWKLKDSAGKEKEIGSKNGGTTGNEVTVTGKGDIAVTVNDEGMTIDGTKLTENIKTDAIKIKDNNGGLLEKDLSDEIEITGKG
ncbi:hypothetical protein [Escherichia coli]|uniref:hypothetical protein n=1 Tax=Escherichia coli TaxID=562 RepID=UPI000D12A083|nr:hypothetical protein [Escherichia coli]